MSPMTTWQDAWGHHLSISFLIIVPLLSVAVLSVLRSRGIFLVMMLELKCTTATTVDDYRHPIELSSPFQFLMIPPVPL